jgi:hypothetical protein
MDEAGKALSDRVDANLERLGHPPVTTVAHSAAVETHWSLSVVQDADGTSVSCGCGWSDRLGATWLTDSIARVGTRHGRRVQLQVEQIAAARARFRRHECGGRPLEVSS